MEFISNSLDPQLKKIPVSKLPPADIIWPWPDNEVSRSSESVHISSVPPNKSIRDFYLSAVKSGDTSIAPPPIISASEFVPPALIEHLMRNKRSSALGAKFEPGAEITNMEGAMHTFVVPVVPRCESAGDYCFSAGHKATPTVIKKSGGKSVMMTRSVVMSATIHLDFELPTVMVELCMLRNQEILGKDLNVDSEWRFLGKGHKQDAALRGAYDEDLRKHMVFHLTSQHRLPGLAETTNKIMNLGPSLQFLEDLIQGDDATPEQLLHRFTKIGTRTLSLEFLFFAAFQLVRNEFSVLEAVYPQGYIFTYDPPSIFARYVEPELLNRLFILAIKYMSSHNQLGNMRIFAFNDYADPSALELLKIALERQTHVLVLSKGDLFRGEDGRFEAGSWKEGSGMAKGDGGRLDLSKWPAAKGAMLVVHNNSDAFGQNVETEYMSGSLDGAIGSTTSAAASLERARADLMDYVV
ncbi:uncharacterized protein RAG0_04822 [Rhynchosporium agropyri]|uniref:Uncharacterized protein n=1 Tax=Rhynchosporium agropyri TaxID=914238 RepID=A0A1E1KAB7_9HELO|nr:uncharacterized protein RAG0_04822 [Rhynchosporium agropyri]